jgi:iron complex transport system substrate-binding protein
VCSVDLAQVQRVCREMGNDPHIVSLNPFTLEDVLDDILTVGVATGREGTARRAVEGLKTRIAAASKVGEEAAERRGKQLKVPCSSLKMFTTCSKKCLTGLKK